MGQGTRCRRPGCRAWAMRSGEFCRSHQSVVDRAVDGAAGRDPPSDSEEILRRRIASILLQAGAFDAGSHAPLEDEIGALRLVLARLLASEDDPHKLAQSIPRVVDTLVRAIRTQRTVSGAQADGLTESLTQVLIELGLDGPEP
jgi:hypothetical protein